YLRKAGEAAQAAFANTSAIDYFQRVLPLLSDEELVEVRLRLGQVLDLVGQWQEADEQYRLVLNLAEKLGNVSAQGEAERSIGWLLRKQGDFAPAHEWLAKARASFEKAGDPAGVSQVCADTGEIYRLQGMYIEAEGCFQEGLKQAGMAADGQRRLAAQAQALKGSGLVAMQQGAHPRARTFFERGLAIQRELGNKPGIGPLLNNLGIVARNLGEPDVARRLYEECLASFRELGDRWAMCISLNNKGCMLTELREFDSARGALEESLAIARQLGHGQQICISLNSLADLCLDEGACSAARRALEESLSTCARLNYRPQIAYALASLGCIASAEGQPERALRLSGASDALCQSMGMTIQPKDRRRFDRLLEPARRLLGPERAAAAYAEGQAMSMEEAIDYALGG
ncbi:MAG: tetratricopeptide repeat protein, partial [Chloroflexi bacterium]|nr:tetratricopeptide repeat protein [Chloroflexota bacterium]